MAFTTNALDNTTSSLTISNVATTAASGVITTNTTGVISKVETGPAGTLFVGSGTVPKFLAAGTDGYQLIAKGAGADPQWTIGSSVSLGTTQYAVQVGGAAGVVSSLASNGSAGQVLQSGGAAANPAWSTATYPSTIAKGDVVIGTATNTVGVVATATAQAGYVLTAFGAGNLPSWQATSGGTNMKFVSAAYALRNPPNNPIVYMVTNTTYSCYPISLESPGNYLYLYLPATGNYGDLIVITGTHWYVRNAVHVPKSGKGLASLINSHATYDNTLTMTWTGGPYWKQLSCSGKLVAKPGADL